MTHSPPNSKGGGTRDTAASSASPGQKTQTTTCRTKCTSAFCYVNFQGWHHIPGCALHHETLERERVSFDGIRREYQKNGGGDR